MDFYRVLSQTIRIRLQEKNKMYKKLAENAEEMASVNLAKLRRAQAEANMEEDILIFSEQDKS